MTRPTRILAWAGGLFVLLLVLLFVLPLLFRGQIEQRVKTAANESLNARVDWRDLGPQLLPATSPTSPSRSTISPRSAWASSRATPSPRSATSGWCSTWPACWQRHGRAADRGPRRRARPAAALAHRARGRHRQLGHHQEDARGGAPGQAAKPMAISLRRFEISDAAIAFDNRQAKLKASVSGLRPVAFGRLQPEPRRRQDQGRRRHGERHLRRHSLSQPGEARPHRRRAGRPGQEVLHASRTPSSVSTISRSASSGSASTGREEPWRSTSRSTRPAPSS